jgi:hypothetical protein
MQVEFAHGAYAFSGAPGVFFLRHGLGEADDALFQRIEPGEGFVPKCRAGRGGFYYRRGGRRATQG